MDSRALDRHITGNYGEDQFRNHKPLPRARFYLGIGGCGSLRQVFADPMTPTSEAYPQYDAVIGPFRTKAGALFMRDHGKNNPHCRTVADAERLAKQAASK